MCHAVKRRLAENKVKYDKWRLAVFRRDKYKCQKCNTEKLIEAHHIINFLDNEELRYVIANGITLCHICHTEKFHKKYGNKNNTFEQLEEFLSRKIDRPIKRLF